MTEPLFDPENLQLRDASVRRDEFREIARRIVARDREVRKYGGYGDTGVAIARALKAAYQLGLAHAAGNSSSQPARVQKATLMPEAPVAWYSIPPRGRTAFASILDFKCYVVKAKPFTLLPGRSPGWLCYWPPEPDGTSSLMCDYGPTTLAPVIRLGLMQEVAAEGRTYLIPTPKGLATWAAAIEAGHHISLHTEFPEE